MPKLKPGTIVPTPEEEVAIRAGIASDPDAAELDDAWFAKARPVSEAHPGIVQRARRYRGRQTEPTKDHISIRLDADLAAHFRASGPGWQTRLNAVLRRAVFGVPK